MTMYDWLSSNDSGESKYWLVDFKTHGEAVKLNQGFGLDDSIPVFDSERFDSVMNLSPWLIPISDEVLGQLSEVLPKGIGLSCSADLVSLLSHLRSLLIASLNGEEVMFRYYDLKVLSSMSENLEPGEVENFLGCVSSLAINVGDTLKVHTSSHRQLWTAKSGTWWKILPHHFEQQENLSLVSTNLSAWLWQRFPQLMNSHLNAGRDVQPIIEKQLLCPDGTLTQRVMLAAIIIVAGEKQSHSSIANELIVEHKYDEIRYGLHRIAETWG
ncbi:DUF4123 domain-containing protein [Vibrio paucivorans]|uniref:DUF4123 domain-containing protein n=1 Tax=Vibrio paucivorans TaxID=2829489 RepID=A0A9X3CIH1_9VIBR|nr:DUF4123 domain-containing protein [Vibrio paucivorans]MCW8336336.1 DUF4123 domain-containing protein [Vibrio paucivorans]